MGVGLRARRRFIAPAWASHTLAAAGAVSVRRRHGLAPGQASTTVRPRGATTAALLGGGVYLIAACPPRPLPAAAGMAGWPGAALQLELLLNPEKNF
jgi:hypothetical protein